MVVGVVLVGRGGTASRSGAYCYRAGGRDSHLFEHVPAERIPVGEVLIGLQRHLVLKFHELRDNLVPRVQGCVPVVFP